MKQYRLLKPLPGCPVGRLFKADENGIYYHIMTEAEALQDGLKMYNFTKDEVDENPDFFEKLTDNYYVRVYNPKNFDEYNEVDTGLPNELFNTIKQSLSVLNDTSDILSVTPILIIPETYDIRWGIIKLENGNSKLKYTVTIAKADENNRSKG
jgi:hypothetical protein